MLPRCEKEATRFFSYFILCMADIRLIMTAWSQDHASSASEHAALDSRIPKMLIEIDQTEYLFWLLSICSIASFVWVG